MAEKPDLPQVPYISDNPEQDWARFEGVMRHILLVPKDQAVPVNAETAQTALGIQSRKTTSRDSSSLAEGE